MYSQNDEEKHILNACAGFVRGRFLDIGAWNARDKSNTRALYERGWSGVLVEPSPGPAAGLRRDYAGEDRITIIEAAVVVLPMDSIRMHITDDAVSTYDRETFEKWAPHVAYTGEIDVPCVTLAEIYRVHGTFGFVSIDAEGASMALFRQLLDMGARPMCICVEHDGAMTEVRRLAAGTGYRVLCENGENMVIAK